MDGVGRRNCVTAWRSVRGAKSAASSACSGRRGLAPKSNHHGPFCGLSVKFDGMTDRMPAHLIGLLGQTVVVSEAHVAL
jgi:hypothetical protein